ncbi:MAG TPA: type II toxin-antitoxin system RelE/ParE family toxin [Candidatus Limnocylindria bacterium]|nr:type II toxin-antitoxin system RelE/ParE family toxin [Candidatus Limnocylindria bacterium]
MVRLELDEAFLSDAQRQFEYLAETEEWARIDRLDEDIVSLRERLATFPELGRELARAGTRTLRRIPVGRLPYFVWYRFDPHGQGVVRLSRLFHAHQRTPKPRVF